ncbi:hypothetical protein OG864_28650 [Streptomyces sp. NBC_00124]|uniref:hypothetical protein n=1 Tax=Streptomyces sp. NBC_00124 TaxID=2975662 RepID=UPI0022508867|nr:hypothetical protein [Streptomyces sp. NBC_00124]MCX5362670.1 hypothetical protein [Streptomyces sp. NBC_00124]
MGIESDQVVYEYLSRVGDVAQQRQLPSGTRMRLVSELRNEIDRRRAKVPVDSPAAVRRIIDRLGSPDDVVTAAGGTSSEGGTTGAVPQARATPAPTAVPVQRDRDTGIPRPKGLRRIVPVPKPRPAETVDEAPAPPHLASEAEIGNSALQPDWWRTDSTPFGVGESLPAGFVGGVEIPELLKPPPPKEEPKPVVEKAPEAEPETEAGVEVEEAPATRRRLLSLPKGKWTNPLLLIAAGFLVVGAVLGNLVVLLLGWLIAYASRRLTEAETKWAVMFLPGLALTAGIVWLWGRTEGRWGDPIVKGHMNDAIADTWPWVIRGAAVASALFLVWRSQRQR